VKQAVNVVMKEIRLLPIVVKVGEEIVEAVRPVVMELSFTFMAEMEDVECLVVDMVTEEDQQEDVAGLQLLRNNETI